jgi:tellurium resistance protein TerZ
MSISLTKGQKISLKKPDGGTLTKVRVGCGWDQAGGFFGGLIGSSDAIDLDASVGTFSETNELLEKIYFGNLESRNRSIKHSGDNRTGKGEGDDEFIDIDLTSVGPEVKAIVITINSFSGQKFSKIKECFSRLVDLTTNTEIAKYKLDDTGKDNTGLIMAKLYRHNGEWKMAAIGATCNGATFQSIVPEIKPFL